LRAPLAFGSLRAACAAGAALGGLWLLELRSVDPLRLSARLRLAARRLRRWRGAGRLALRCLSNQ
jgi:hypothetical protein